MAAQLTGFPITIALIAATVGFSAQFGIHALAWGVFVSGILQVVILLPALRGTFSYKPRFDVKDENFRRLMLLAIPAVLSMAVNELNHLIDRFLATGLGDGVVAGMNYGYKLITFLQGVLLVPLTTIMFSRMSRQAAKGDRKGIAVIVLQCVEVVSLVILPIMAICAVMSKDVICAAYMRGKFDASSVAITAGPFLFYVIGLWGFGVRDLLNRSFHSLQDTKTPMINSAITVALNIGLNILLVRVMGASGLALATSVSGMLGAGMMFVRLRRRIGRVGGQGTLIELGKICLCTALCAFVCLVLDYMLPQAQSSLMALIRLGGTAVISLIVYAAAALVVRVRPVAVLIGMIARKLNRA